jgi:hypothetical protein
VVGEQAERQLISYNTEAGFVSQTESGRGFNFHTLKSLTVKPQNECRFRK